MQLAHWNMTQWFSTPKDPQSSLSNQWWVPWWIPRSPLAPGLRKKSRTSGWNIRMMATRYPLNKTSQFEPVPDDDYPVILRPLGFFSSWFGRRIHHPWVDEIKLNRYHPSPRHCQVNDPLEGLPVAKVFGRCNQFFANFRVNITNKWINQPPSSPSSIQPLVAIYATLGILLNDTKHQQGLITNHQPFFLLRVYIPHLVSSPSGVFWLLVFAWRHRSSLIASTKQATASKSLCLG